MTISLRPARQDDSAVIKDLIHRTGINPIGLDWRRFTLAVDEQDRMAGCGQLKPHGDGTLELASVAVEESHRGQGIARMLIEHLIESAPPIPLYLTCRGSLGPLYERFGFRRLTLPEMTTYFRRISKLAVILKKIRLVDEELFVMRLDRPES